MTSSPKSILMAGGGTGGHLWPGIALAEALYQLDPRLVVYFLVPGRPVDKTIMAACRYPWCVNPMRPVPTSLQRLPSFCIQFVHGWAATLRMFRRCRPHLVVGLGGYGALSAGLLAKWRHIPFVLLESNTHAGKVVRWLSGHAAAVYANSQVSGVAAAKVKPLGIPIRADLAFRKQISGDNRTPLHVLVMGGSQGAACINRAMSEAAEFLQPWRDRLSVVHLCGQQQNEIATAYQRNNITATVMPFCTHMAQLYRQADVMVCRAGGSTLAEIQAIGLPALLIPFAQAAGGHQLQNARGMEQAGAAVVVSEDALRGATLAQLLGNFVDDRQRLAAMAEKASAMGRPNAAQDVASDILSVLECVKR